jgi:hypothetical protein
MVENAVFSGISAFLFSVTIVFIFCKGVVCKPMNYRSLVAESNFVPLNILNFWLNLLQKGIFRKMKISDTVPHVN